MLYILRLYSTKRPPWRQVRLMQLSNTDAVSGLQTMSSVTVQSFSRGYVGVLVHVTDPCQCICTNCL